MGDKARRKEWQRSKFGERKRTTNFGYRNRGRRRAHPAGDEARRKEWQRSKFGERKRTTNFGYRNRKSAAEGRTRTHSV